jgi:hypothetical protein
MGKRNPVPLIGWRNLSSEGCEGEGQKGRHGEEI